MFQFQASLASHTELSYMQTSLGRWIRLWTQTDHQDQVERREASGPEDMWRRTGFMRHAEEFWLLAQVTLDNMKHPQAYGDVAISGLDAGIARVARLTYNDNDMEQVRHMVTAFQDLSFL